MDKTKIKATGALIVFGTFLRVASAAGAQVDCDKDQPGTLQKAIDKAAAGAVIVVSGTCDEHVTIPEGRDRITLSGGGQATIHGPNTAIETVAIAGRGITLTGFTITGGLDGVSVNRGGNATIDGNTIQGTGRFGIGVNQMAFAVIVNNAIHDNPDSGISVAGNSFAFIGFREPGDTVASPNIVQHNDLGIDVSRSSAARIAGNDISNNTRHGVRIQRGSQSDISDNAINGNRLHGIHVTGGSSVMLGANTGDTLLTRSNFTTVSNGQWGIRCEIGGSADGRLGTLKGVDGGKSVVDGCFDSLAP